MDRILSPELENNFDEMTLRPQTLNEYVGQVNLKDNLKVFIEAA